jgi:hypothetical protein
MNNKYLLMLRASLPYFSLLVGVILCTEAYSLSKSVDNLRWQVDLLNQRENQRAAQSREELARLFNHEHSGSGTPGTTTLMGAGSLQAIVQNQVSAAAGLGYLELLLEGIARKMGLPIEQAHIEFGKRPGGVPAGWTWTNVWETPNAPAR